MKMTNTEAKTRLDISAETLGKWRKSLGIFKETHDGITESQFKQLENLKNNSPKGGAGVHRSPTVAKRTTVKPALDSPHRLAIYDTDPVEVRNMKSDYNFCRSYVDAFKAIIENGFSDGKIPEKYISDSVEKFMIKSERTLKDLRKIQPPEDAVSQEIAKRLAR